jgi:hypothetical protein
MESTLASQCASKGASFMDHVCLRDTTDTTAELKELGTAVVAIEVTGRKPQLSLQSARSIEGLCAYERSVG